MLHWALHVAMSIHETENDGGYGWVVVFAGFLFSFLEVGTLKSCGVFLAEVIADFDSTPSVVGFAFGLFTGLIYLSIY